MTARVASAGPGQRQRDRAEGPQPAGAVDVRGLLQLERDAQEELAHEEHAEHAGEAGQHQRRAGCRTGPSVADELDCGTRNITPGRRSVVMSRPNRTLLPGKSIRANA